MRIFFKGSSGDLGVTLEFVTLKSRLPFVATGRLLWSCCLLLVGLGLLLSVWVLLMVRMQSGRRGAGARPPGSFSNEAVPTPLMLNLC